MRPRSVPSGFVALLAVLAISAVARAAIGDELVAVREGTLPIILSNPHDGYLAVPGCPKRTGADADSSWGGFVTGNDVGVRDLAGILVGELENMLQGKLYIVDNLAKRAYVDVNRPPGPNAYECDGAKAVYDAYHSALAAARLEVVRRWGRGFLLDLHDTSASYLPSMAHFNRGTGQGKTVPKLLQLFGDEALLGPNSILGYLEALGYSVQPDHTGGRENWGIGYIIDAHGSHRVDGVDAMLLEVRYPFFPSLGVAASDLAAAMAVFHETYLPLSDLPKPVTVTAIAGANGSISPSGEVTALTGESPAFTITPAPGYQVLDVKVDGESIGVVTSYAFPDIAANHTITASFALYPQPPVEIVVDNGDAGTSQTGEWGVSGGANPYGTDSLYAKNGATYTWTVDSLPSGLYEVFIWWSGYPTRPDGVPVQISHRNGQSTVYIDQRQNAGTWNSLGQYFFDGSGSITLSAVGEASFSTCADAVRFWQIRSLSPPVAEFTADVTSGKPPLGVAFTDASPGTVTGWTWDFGDGSPAAAEQNPTHTYSAAGSYTVSLTVVGPEGTSSRTKAAYVRVTAETIIDNGDPGTSSTGTWEVSGGSVPYGPDSLYSRNGATYSWSAASLPGGLYEVFLWWSAYPSRSTNVAVQIAHHNGQDTVYVNQLQDAARWNSVGQYFFDGTGGVTIVSSQGSTVSTCADAVRFVRLDALPPLVANFTAHPVVGPAPLTVAFADASTGTVTDCSWDFGDGTPVVAEPNPTHTYVESGTYTVSLTVAGPDGSNTQTKEDYISVGVETIIDNGDPGTSSTGTWEVSGGSGPYGPDSLYSRNGATYSWSAASLPAGLYEVFLWWSAYPSRSTEVAVQISHQNGQGTVYVNQLQNASRWNTLGRYYFDSAGHVTIISSQGSRVSTCADAVRFLQIH